MLDAILAGAGAAGGRPSPGRRDDGRLRGRPPYPSGSCSTPSARRWRAATARVGTAPAAGVDARDLQPPVPFSFDRAALDGARAAAGTRVPVPSLAGSPLPPREALDLELARWWRSSGIRSGRSSVAASGSPCSTRVTRSPTGSRSSSTTCRSGLSATGCCATCCAAGLPSTPWRRSGGVVCCRPDAWAGAWPATDPGGEPGRRDGRVGHPGAGAARGGRRRRPGGGRRLRGTVTGLYGERIVIATFSRLGPRQWLEAWIPLLALCAEPIPAGTGRRARSARGRRPATAPPTRRLPASPSPAWTRRPTCCATWWRCTTPASASRSRSR